MKKMMLVAAIVGVVGIGCTKKKKEEGTGGPTMGSGSSMAMGSGSGGAMMAGSGSAGAAMAGSGSAAAPAKPLTADELAKKVDTCWGYYNDSKWDDFKNCYTADAVVEVPGSGMPADNGQAAIVDMVKPFKTAIPDDHGEVFFTLVSGHNVITVANTVGKNSGPFKMGPMEMPASNNKVGGVFAQVLEMTDDGKAKHEWDFFDMATTLGQMKPDPKHPVRAPMDKAPMAKEVVISKDDAGEKANMETVKKAAEAFSKHDAKAFGDALADDAMWSEMVQPKDWNKKDALANMAAFWKAFSDIKVTPGQVWAAGDYVAMVANMDGTNDGDFAAMGIKKTGKKVSLPHLAIFKVKDGKIHNAWIIDQAMGMMGQLGLMPMPGAGGAEHAGSGAGSAAAGSGAGSAAKHDDKKPDDKKPAKK
jgi:ketosteroid isomerase-like protein